MANTEVKQSDPELEMLRLNKDSGYEYRKRRHEAWRENYTLYRDTVQVNRLLQRQSVNLPLMKQTIRTLLKDVDDMPVVQFENLDNDKQAEIFQNEYWKWTLEQNKAELKDIVDKRQVMHFGRTFDQWQIVDGMIKWSIEDPEDILVSRFMDPTDLDSSRFLIHTHIFVPLTTLEKNEDYNKEAITELKKFYASDLGIIKTSDNIQMMTDKNQKLADLGVDDLENPSLGETYVELSMHFCYHKEKEDKEEELYLYVEADDQQILMKKKLEEVIGNTEDHYWRTHFPYNSWADDVDRQDFWTDGVSDIIRTPNKVLNAWFSQEVENRTLKNLNMNIFDSSLEGFTPQTWTPQAWGMYGIPLGANQKIDDVFKPLPVSDLNGNLESMTFVIGMSDKASGATATLQGAQTERSITLGEVQLALGEAKERVKGMAKFYTPAWKERATKFLKLIEASPDKLDAVKIYKKGRNSDNMYTREVSPSDWMTDSGYTTRIWSQADKREQDTKAIELSNAVKANMPDNPVVDEQYKRKLLEFAEYPPDKINEAMEFEAQKRQQLAMAQQMMMQQGMMGVPPQGGQPAQPQQPAMGV